MNRLLTSLAFAIALLSIGWPVLESSAQYAVAQTTGVSHEITSWNRDGTITVAVSVRLPNAFSNAEGTITTEIGCGDLDACESSDVVVVGTAQTGVTLRFFVHLSTGDNILSIRVAASDSGGGTIEHVVDDYLISVPEPQSLIAELTEYEIVAFHDDGSADLSFWFDVQQADPWPVNQFRAAIACVETHPCGTIISISPGWGESSPAQSVHAVNLVVRRVGQGERRFLASFYDTTEQWTGPDKRDTRTYVDLTIPNALKPEVELSGYQLSAVNGDQTVDVTLDFTLTRPDAWPMSSIRTSLNCVRGAECEVEEAITPAWVDDDTVTEHTWEQTISNLPQSYVQLAATFDAEPDVWYGSARVETLNNLLIDSRDTEKFNVAWQTSSSDVKGYYMDGSALVDLTLSAKQLGSETTVEDDVTSVCYTSDRGDSEVCQSIERAVTASIGTEESTVTVPGIRLPQGERSLKIFAGKASGEAQVAVPKRIVGFRREMWDCFTDASQISEIAAFFGAETCSGFQGTIVRKWTLDTVNVYREGDATYVEIFDDALSFLHSITGIDYVIVDDAESAHFEAYVGHRGHPRVLELLGDYCNEVKHCSHSYSSTNAHYTVDRGIMGVRHRGDVTLGEGSIGEEVVRSLATDYLYQTMIPVGGEIRPFLLALRDRATSMRPHDVLMFQLIYLPSAVPGMEFSDLREFVIFDDETLDYVPSLPPADVVAYKVLREYFEAGSISVNMTGSEVRGGVTDSGPTIAVQYADFSAFNSNRIRVSSDDRSSIIFGNGEETWLFADGSWSISEDHDDASRAYRDELKFDFPLTDPTRMLYTEVFGVYDSRVTQNDESQYVYTVERNELNTAWPEPWIEIIIDPETYRVVSYTMEWHFDAEDSVRSPYRVEAEVIEYGAASEIPDAVKQASQYLADLESE